MRILTIVQALFAIAFLLVGLVALFGIGITGLIILASGIAFAAIAGVTEAQSRGAVVLALAADAVLGYFAVGKLQSLLHPAANGQAVGALPGWLDFLAPAAALVLITAALIAVLLDWRAVRASPWFEQRQT